MWGAGTLPLGWGPKGAESQRPPFSEFLSIYAYRYILCRRTTKFDVITHSGRGLVFIRSIAPPPQGGGDLALPDFEGSILYVRTFFVAELPNLTG